MSSVLIWDLPTRLFHWLLSSGFIVAAVISLLLGDDSPLFPYHAIIGLIIAVMFIAIAGAWAVGLIRNYNPSTKTTTLPLIGTVLQLGENENESDGAKNNNGNAKRDDDD